MHELSKLITERKGDLSYEDLARRSGGDLDRRWVARLGKGDEPVRAVPSPQTLNGLARALGVSVDRVAVAALRSAGVPVRDRWGARDPLDGLFDQLTPSQQDALVHLARVMADPHAAPPAPEPDEAEKARAAGAIIEAARARENLHVRDAAAQANIRVRDWQAVVTGNRPADEGTWLDITLAARADPAAVFTALGRDLPDTTD